MSDFRHRLAVKKWLEEHSEEAWAEFLAESSRNGIPVFTQEMLEQALQPDGFHITPTVQSFEITPTGFIAVVEKSINPPVEQLFRIPYSPGDYEEEYYPLWDWWSGKMKLEWSDYFEPAGPTLEIEVLDIFNSGDLFPNSILREYVYDDEITDAETLTNALQDPLNWSS